MAAERQSHDIECSMGNTVNNTATTMYGARSVLDLLRGGGHFKRLPFTEYVFKVHPCYTTYQYFVPF